VEQHLEPLRFGGTGTQSDDERQPDSLPDKFEAGNHNLPGIAGLAAATHWLRERTLPQIAAHHQALTARLLSGLRDIPELTLYGPPPGALRTSVVSFTLRGYDPQELAALLDASRGVQCRAGLHCAPRMHEALGTKLAGGALRLSPGCFTTTDEVDAAIAALQEAAALAP
ncbi:MAG TPA: aminotransferase class V-fold PLP-dependent enzyme, partial [Lacipirellulaceae bacterium]|nr:aminotransferase class V-fold PLP-dependent enzyme [Lacipirellulaceae bacterium]